MRFPPSALARLREGGQRGAIPLHLILASVPMRYTHKSLCADLLALNAKLEKAGHAMRLVDGRRYGYSAVDLATEEQVKRYCTQRMLCGGTPRECLAEAQAYVLQQI